MGVRIVRRLEEVERHRPLGKQRPEDVLQIGSDGVEVVQGRAHVLLEEVLEDSAVVPLQKCVPETARGKPRQVFLGRGTSAHERGGHGDGHTASGR